MLRKTNDFKSLYGTKKLLNRKDNQMNYSKAMKYYAKLSNNQKEYVKQFKIAHSEKSMCIDGVIWNYFDSEKGDESLLLLHGGFVDFDMWIHQIMEFKKEYRIIAPTCPVLPKPVMKVYSDALHQILIKEKIIKTNLIGYSEGGLIAQCFLRDYSSTISKAILSQTFYPSNEIKYYKNDFKLFKILPSFLTTLIFRLAAKPDKEELNHDSTEWIEWYKCYFKEIKYKLTKGKIITHINLMSDFVRNYIFNAKDLISWKGKMLITVSKDDVILKYFDGLRKLYPNAEYHMFPSGLGAHSIGLITPSIYNKRISLFLKQ